MDFLVTSQRCAFQRASLWNLLPCIGSWQAAFYYALSSTIIISLTIACTDHWITTLSKRSRRSPRRANIENNVRFSYVPGTMLIFSDTWNRNMRNCSEDEVGYAALLALCTVLIPIGCWLAGSVIARRWAPEQEFLGSVAESAKTDQVREQRCASSMVDQACMANVKPPSKEAFASKVLEQKCDADLEPHFHDWSIYTDDQRAES
ncbi:hypothetical protein LTR81_022950 [Elasticomyces elasticus]